MTEISPAVFQMPGVRILRLGTLFTEGGFNITVEYRPSGRPHGYGTTAEQHALLAALDTSRPLPSLTAQQKVDLLNLAVGGVVRFIDLDAGPSDLTGVVVRWRSGLELSHQDEESATYVGADGTELTVAPLDALLLGQMLTDTELPAVISGALAFLKDYDGAQEELGQLAADAGTTIEGYVVTTLLALTHRARDLGLMTLEPSDPEPVA